MICGSPLPPDLNKPTVGNVRDNQGNLSTDGIVDEMKYEVDEMRLTI